MTAVRSLMPPSRSIRTSRPSLGSRGSSQSSIRSLLSPSCPPSPSPNATEKGAYFAAASSSATSTDVVGRTTSAGVHNNTMTLTGNIFTTHTQPGQESPRINRSKPIAIHIPPGRKKSGPTDTPPEPLSARGDLRGSGGYFPFHEDGSRSNTSHPAHPAEHSLHPTTTGSKPQPSPGATDSFFSSYSHPPPDSAATTIHDAFRRPSLRKPPNTSAYLPTMSIAQGKYHPSNYKSLTAPSSMATPQPSLHTTLLPADATSATDIRRKLQQYQRDMVEQAAMAARLSVPGGEPVSPRLCPLGSPGPVTPWELDGGEGEGYLERGGGSSAAIETKMGESAKAAVTTAPKSL